MVSLPCSLCAACLQLRRLALRPQTREETLDLAPCFFTAVESFPTLSEAADQLVASIDRDNVAIKDRKARGILVHEQRLDVRRKFLQQRIRARYFAPGIQ